MGALAIFLLTIRGNRRPIYAGELTILLTGTADNAGRIQWRIAASNVCVIQGGQKAGNSMIQPAYYLTREGSLKTCMSVYGVLALFLCSATPQVLIPACRTR